jgi:integrase/recombinase XerD
MGHWYKEGVNPQSKLPYLATFLGHKDIESTLVYLYITPEILAPKARRACVPNAYRCMDLR